jgi:predicted ATPase
MAMDMFFNKCKIQRKRRVHFNKFMLDVHVRIHEFKKELLLKFGREVHVTLSSERDAIAHVARQIAMENWLLFFDEFQVNDIADAVIMTKLFNELWQRGTVLIATSNCAPDNLYEDGLNRAYFLPFIEALKQQCTIFSMNSELDYRFLKSSGKRRCLYPLNDENRMALWNSFSNSATSSRGAVTNTTVPIIMGRSIDVLSCGNSCWVTFESLCLEYRGAADYSALCKRYRTVFVEGVKKMKITVFPFVLSASLN